MFEFQFYFNDSFFLRLIKQLSQSPDGTNIIAKTSIDHVLEVSGSAKVSQKQSSECFNILQGPSTVRKLIILKTSLFFRK